MTEIIQVIAIRVPLSLKDRIDQRATQLGISSASYVKAATAKALESGF